ncbi:MAG TPA: response regulator [Acetobacteraceae bacterium]|jgi:two-component system, OmpR family, response regulator VicR|nr:response regulator [Acetobacteraceae bacterium]
MSKKLLLVDNHRDVAGAIDAIIQPLDIIVRVVDDSRKAVATFLSFAPDFVILDMVMKDIDGIDVLSKLIATGRDALIILAASPGIGEAYVRIAQGVARFNGLGPLQVLHKPFDEAQLRALLAQVVSSV